MRIDPVDPFHQEAVLLELGKWWRSRCGLFHENFYKWRVYWGCDLVSQCTDQQISQGICKWLTHFLAYNGTCQGRILGRNLQVGGDFHFRYRLRKLVEPTSCKYVSRGPKKQLHQKRGWKKNTVKKPIEKPSHRGWASCHHLQQSAPRPTLQWGFYGAWPVWASTR